MTRYYLNTKLNVYFFLYINVFSFKFRSLVLFDHINSKSLSKLFDDNNYHMTIKGIINTCKVIRTKSRGEINMFCIGSTIGAARYPLFVNPVTNKNSILPRPVVNSRPNGLSSVLFQTYWFHKLTKNIEKFLFKYLSSLDSSIEANKRLLKSIAFSKTIPLSLRVCDTIFHQVFIVTNNNDIREIKAHKDQNDLINCLLTIGKAKSGADLIFFPTRKRKFGEDSNDTKEIILPWKHGNLIIGNFNEVLHSVSRWKGNLFFMNFTIKIPILNHFKQYGYCFYKQFEDANFPSKHFIAK